MGLKEDLAVIDVEHSQRQRAKAQIRFLTLHLLRERRRLSTREKFELLALQQRHPDFRNEFSEALRGDDA